MEKVTNLVELKNRLFQMIYKGVEEEPGIFRPMDLVDYYELTNISIKDVLTILNKNVGLTVNEKNWLIAFRKKALSAGLVEYSKDEFIKKHCKDKLNYKGLEITDEMKQQAILYMENNSIPFMYMTYYCVLKRIATKMLADMKRD